ncbi:hypothetical protein KCU90_g97, partial [Aureobasidium melanogenum]
LEIVLLLRVCANAHTGGVENRVFIGQMLWTFIQTMLSTSSSLSLTECAVFGSGLPQDTDLFAFNVVAPLTEKVDMEEGVLGAEADSEALVKPTTAARPFEAGDSASTTDCSARSVGSCSVSLSLISFSKLSNSQSGSAI